MSRRWHLGFKSRNEVQCDLYISDDDYSGSVVELTGADNPFYFEENDSGDLADVIRTKTGYIRLIEMTENELADVYPSTIRGRFVEFYYNGTLDFEGYIQLQDIDNEWVGCPRVLKFPVVSPLGLLDHGEFNLINPPCNVSFGELMSEIITWLNVSYERVIFPDLSGDEFQCLVNSLFVCDYNSEFTYDIDSTIPLFKSIDYETFVEGMCRYFGWIVHDTPTAIIFSKYNADGGYKYYEVSDLATQSNLQTQHAADLTQAIADYFNVAGADGKQGILLPYKKVVLNNDFSYISSCQFNFSHQKYHGRTDVTFDGDDMHVAWLVTEDNPDITGYRLHTVPNTLSASGNFELYGVDVVDCGVGESMKKRIICTYDEDHWTSSEPLFNVHFFEPPTRDSFTVNYDLEWFGSIRVIDEKPTYYKHYEPYFRVRVGDEYYQGDGTWSTTAPALSLPTLPYKVLNAPRGPVHIEFFAGESLGGEHGTLTIFPSIAISNISLAESLDIFEEYQETFYNGDKLTFDNGEGEDEKTIDRLFSDLNVTSPVGAAIQPYVHPYRYYMVPMNRLQATFNNYAGTMPSNIYTSLWTYWQSGWKWRLIAMSFYPWDDEIRLTLHHSEYLD